jgi:2-polyprenyl-3-methyl-5-hydroxy-6-metoxy-1,4-benzoquinol methylase
MENKERKNHWENIYQTKEMKDFSWFQETPATSLSFFEKYDVPQNAKIIDIGGGDSFLPDELLAAGYSDITVLDISAAALERAKIRLGEKAEQIKWIVADAADFQPAEKYDVWHDRAAFHFLTKDEEVARYIKIATENINASGFFFVGTFSENGPKKCSGIDIRQYSEESLSATVGEFFDKKDCFTAEHQTPFNTVQNFIFAVFERNSINF